MNVSKSKVSSIDPFRTPHAKNYHMNLFSFSVHDERDALSMLFMFNLASKRPFGIQSFALHISIKTCHNTFFI